MGDQLVILARSLDEMFNLPVLCIGFVALILWIAWLMFQGRDGKQ